MTDPKTTTLPPFSGDDPTCPKCGNVGASTRYRAIGTCYHEAGEVLGMHRNERLHRECHRCDYAWDEAIVEPVEPSFIDRHVDPDLMGPGELS